MDMEFLFGLMGESTKVIGKKDFNKAKVFINHQQAKI